ncbi:PKD domain-containing protein [Nonomuraea sp. NN258]|uniref:collagenase n=1 Tax=Nonomuraea antri TaxID=2730852 RepID=UPI001568DAAC|nr:collagenase [Nonomuraea antri]NRQ39244.1 PKD domain-containing protein [Nonomuraea antri]
MKYAASILLAAGLALTGVTAVPAIAESASSTAVAQAGTISTAVAQAGTITTAGRSSAAGQESPPPVGAADAGAHTGRDPLHPSERAPLPATKDQLKRDYDGPDQDAAPRRLAAACDVQGKTGSALVTAIKAADDACMSGLFGLTGSAARAAFQESQMVTVAYALRDNAASYPGDNSTSTGQLVLYLRAGYYVQWYNPSDVGSYGAALKSAIRAGLDAFFASSRSGTVSNANGEVLAEAVTLIDSAQENARYIYVVKRLLNAYDSTYDGLWSMLNAVNNVYTVLWRGHQVPEFVSAVQSDPSVLDTLASFASRNMAKLGTDSGFLVSNGGRELARFVQYAPLQAKTRPLLRSLLQQSSITGPTAPLWVGIAEMADYYDNSNCSYYDICDLQNRLKAAVLPIEHSCGATLRIRAQDMTAAQLQSTCSSLANQDAYFHDLVDDSGPVAGDRNTTLEVVAFDSSTDYQTYAGAMFGIDTNNGGMYLEGDPAAAGNQPRFIAYEAEWLRPEFHIWNLNHEYTHYLDGRFNMHGDFSAGVSTPTIWWIEGFAEYVSYGYRGLTYDAAVAEAGRHTHQLRALFDTTYEHDTTRIYRWGYLAVRYMFEKHRADLTTVLGHYRTGNWNAARSHLTSLSYNADFDAWLTACAAGACGGGTGNNQAPVASFTAAVNGLAVSFADTSNDPDGTIASRSWEFGDGTTSTAANPAKTYASAGTYTVRLTVTDDKGATGTATKQVTVASTAECAGADRRELGKNCKRSNLAASRGNYAYLYLNVPAGTTRLTITSSGGTGDADLYYHAASWATTTSYTQRSTGAGNTHTITIPNPPSGYQYVSLYGVTAFSGVTVTTSY